MTREERDLLHSLPPGYELVFEMIINRLECIEAQVNNHIPTAIGKLKDETNSKIAKVWWGLLAAQITLNGALIVMILRPWV